MNAPSGFWLLIGLVVICAVALTIAELRDWQQARRQKEELEPRVKQALKQTYGSRR